MKIVRNIVISTLEPPVNNVAWLKPLSNGNFTLLFFGTKGWTPVSTGNLDDIINEIDNPIKTKELYYDDGTGEVVPIKHPDLSTQPSILPYKFAGNYVYEQMFYIEGIINDDAHMFPLMPADKETIFLESSFSGETTEGVIKTYEHEIQIYEDNAVIEFTPRWPETMTCEFKHGWVRLVWTTKPKAGEYYYSEQEDKLTFKDITDGKITYLYDSSSGRFYSESGKIWIDSRGKETLLQGGYLKWSGPEEENVVYICYGSNRTPWHRDQPLYLSLPADGGQGGIGLGSIIGSTVQEFIAGTYSVELSR